MNAPNDLPPEPNERTARLEAILPTLATKADLAEVKGELSAQMGNIERDLAVIKNDLGHFAAHYATKADLFDLHANVQKDIRMQTWLIVAAMVIAPNLPNLVSAIRGSTATPAAPNVAAPAAPAASR